MRQLANPQSNKTTVPQAQVQPPPSQAPIAAHHAQTTATVPEYSSGFVVPTALAQQVRIAQMHQQWAQYYQQLAHSMPMQMAQTMPQPGWYNAQQQEMLKQAYPRFYAHQQQEQTETEVADQPVVNLAKKHKSEQDIAHTTQNEDELEKESLEEDDINSNSTQTQRHEDKKPWKGTVQEPFTSPARPVVSDNSVGYGAWETVSVRRIDTDELEEDNVANDQEQRHAQEQEQEQQQSEQMKSETAPVRLQLQKNVAHKQRLRKIFSDNESD